MADNNIIYLKDVIKGKTPSEILSMFPFMVCKVQTNNDGTKRYKSYVTLGVTPNALLLDDYVLCENNDDFSYGYYTREKSYFPIELDKLESLDNSDCEFIYCHDASEKQKEFVRKYCGKKENDCISGYEAYCLISEKCAQWEKENEERANKKSTQKRYSRFDNDYFEPDEFDYGYDVPNM